MPIHDDSIIFMDCLLSKHLSHWTTVMNWLLYCLYLTMSFPKARIVVFFFFFFFNLCISSAWHSTCLKVDIQYMFVPCLGILFLLSNIWASYFAHRHILSEQRGRERSRSYQKQKKETVRRTIYGSLWLTSGSHSLGLLKFIKPCKSKQKVSI